MPGQLTKEEKDWVKKLNKLLEKCPSTRLGFYTGGDPFIKIYDKEQYEDLMLEYKGDPIDIIDEYEDAGFDEQIDFPSNVEGWCI